MKTIISPSLLSCDFANIEAELKALQGTRDIWIHLDVMDGHFVPNLTFGIPVVKRIAQVSDQVLDVHLMVTNPLLHIEKMKDFGLHNVTFHLEAVSDPMALILQAKKYYPSVGVSICPQTPVEEFSDQILQNVDLVLVMSVHPGQGGQSFLSSSLKKITALAKRRKQLGPDFSIQVDGGINQKTAGLAIAAGADNLVAGTYIFDGPSHTYLERIEQLWKH